MTVQSNMPPQNTWKLSADAAYVHYTPNETIGGVEFNWVPEIGNVPLVADMSSNILSRLMDVSKYGLIYAGAQKNIGPSGLTVVIVREDLIGQPIFSTQLLTQVIRFYGDSLQGVIGNYLERSIQLFTEQQQQLRGHLGSLMGQTPWALLNPITERNMEVLKGLQQGLINGLNAPAEKSRDTETPTTDERPAAPKARSRGSRGRVP